MNLDKEKLSLILFMLFGLFLTKKAENKTLDWPRQTANQAAIITQQHIYNIITVTISESPNEFLFKLNLVSTLTFTFEIAVCKI